MTTESPQQEGRDRAPPTLDTFIRILDAAKTACVFPQAQIAIGSTSALLTSIIVSSPLIFHCEFQFAFIQNSTSNKQNYVELGKSCGRVCQALDRGLDGRRPDELTQSALEAIEQLTT